MPNLTCSVDECASPREQWQNVCSLHRSRQRAGKPEWRTCTVCHMRIEDRPKKSKVCADHDRCSVPECDRRPHSKGLCGKHYAHNRAHGNSVNTCRTCGQAINLGPGMHYFCSEECRPECKVDGCDYKVRGATDICGSHRQQLKETGELSPRRRWTQDWACVVCGKAVEKGSGRRKHCSVNCQQLDSRWNGERPTVVSCVSCGEDIDLLTSGRGRKKWRRADVKLCDKCRRKQRYGTTVYELAKLYGVNCGICDQPVDMDAAHPDLMRASVDHILPRSRGGTDDLDNLQLSHLICNIRKNNKVA